MSKITDKGRMVLAMKGARPQLRILAPRRLSSLGRIYFVQGISGGPIKIGWSKWVHQRLQDMQIGSPVPLKILATIPGSQPEERRVHKRFKGIRIRGEWFDPSPELLEFIGSLVACHEAAE